MPCFVARARSATSRSCAPATSCIGNLRHKIEPDDASRRHIRTDAGIGYRFVSDTS
jgi:DNA-binding response OmpR family regulator